MKNVFTDEAAKLPNFENVKMPDIRNLSAETTGKTILGGLSPTLNPGEVHAIRGPVGVQSNTLAIERSM